MDRRDLRFNSPAELRADIERIVAADRTGRLRCTGNWTAGQTFGHLATWINFAYDGFPSKPPWFIKMILKRRKSTFIDGPMPTGVKIPRVDGGTYGTEPRTLDDGYQRLVRAWDRLEKTAPTQPHTIFGPMPHDEWTRMHLRHAELHLGFLHP